MKKASVLLAALFVLTGISHEPAYGAAPGIYLADCTPNYRHPYTGVIEDTGGESSFALGQSMTESATGKQALVEVDEAGNTYVTVRLSLMDNISDVSFLIDGGQASPALIQQDPVNHTADYRMLVFNESSVITASLYVEPMGRYVTYYITLSNLRPGSGDFVPQITVAEAAPEAAPEATPEVTAEPTVEATPEAASEATPEAAPEATGEPTVEATPEATAEPTVEAAETVVEETPEAEKKEGGLQEFDAQGNSVEEEEETEEIEKAEKSTEKKSNGGMWIGIVLGGIVVAGGAWYFVSYKKKK